MYFATVAEEQNLHRAAERLFISQPPLSRQIKQLEERLGFPLFVRHTRGVTLTPQGVEALRAIRPLLALHEKVLEQLEKQVKPHRQKLTFGFTTAFDQGIFSTLEARLREQYGADTQVLRLSSPRLVREIKNGRIDLAFVALPLETQGLTAVPLGYLEEHVVALPACWAESEKDRVSLGDLQEKPLFWFRREQNPAFYDFARAVFTQAGFSPVFQEEPLEHDVLLARIAAGEAAGLFPASFAVVHREGVVYKHLAQAGQLQLQLGIIAAEVNESLLHEVLEIALHVPPCA